MKKIREIDLVMFSCNKLIVRMLIELHRENMYLLAERGLKQDSFDDFNSKMNELIEEYNDKLEVMKELGK